MTPEAKNGERCLRELSINQCPKHGDYWSISIDDEAGGSRLTPSKCCGQWRRVCAWKLSVRDWREMAEQAEKAAADLEGDEE